MNPQIKDLYYLNVEQTADALAVFPHVINETLKTNPSYFEKEVHYTFIKEQLCFSRVGLVRLAVIIGTDEGLIFARILEKELLAFEEFFQGVRNIVKKEDRVKKVIF